MQTENRLIYAEDAKRAIEHYDPAFSYVIDNVPSVDFGEVVHGQWIKDSRTYHYRCSECGTYNPYDTVGDYIDYLECYYCPHCGARMDGDK
jgi:predicted SprT family Zn-dependent metalloprotease